VKRGSGCAFCGRPVRASADFVLVLGRRHDAHCSAACLEQNVHARRRARAEARRRWLLSVGGLALLLAGPGMAWLRFRTPPGHSISLEWPEKPPADVPPPAPIVFGPPWPPTDEQWTAVLGGANGMFPLPGPTRRETSADGHIFGLDPPRDHPPLCRQAGRCAVDLGGELWGEHVYAALDGVVDRVHGGDDERRGGYFVRLSHFGGQVFTQYFHLAATPRNIVRGAHVRAGDVIGLLGDTGLAGERRHLSFSLSIRPSTDLPEVYWDPKPWLARWHLRAPANGTVAGFMPRQNP
jgi:murein DD-endopeptidase MepM/ murein hydrolase activator NlpD